MDKEVEKKSPNSQNLQEKKIDNIIELEIPVQNDKKDNLFSNHNGTNAKLKGNNHNLFAQNHNIQINLEQNRNHEASPIKSPFTTNESGTRMLSNLNKQTLQNPQINGINTNSNQTMISNSQKSTQPSEKSTPPKNKKKKSSDFTENDEELFTLLNQDEASQRSDSNSQEEDKKVLIIYAGGFFGAEYDYSQGSYAPLILTRNQLFNKMQKISYFCDVNFTYQHATDGFLVTPISEYKKRIYYKVVEMENLKINSTFFDRSCVEELLDIIDQNYETFDSFVVIHGTDSMAYSASFVSFMIENLSKPIIFTGSMVPLSIMRNDSFNNLLGALTIAGHFNIPEVCIFFHNKLLRANRSTKVDAQGLDCFNSPNFPTLAEFKVHIEVNWTNILRNDEFQTVKINKKFTDHKIEIMRYNPCFSEVSLSHLLKTPDLKGVIIEGYGPGNLPFYDDNFSKICQEAAQNEVYIVAVSQSIKSYTSQFNSEQQTQLNIIYGGNMTTEATLAKLSYLITKGISYKEIMYLMNQNIRGELTPHSNDQKFEVRQENLIEAITEKFNNRVNYRQSQVDLIKSYIVPNVACYMAQFGFMHYLEEMKVQKTNFKFCDYDRRTALHVAVRESREQVCKFLIDEQVDVNFVDYFGRSPLYEAILTKNKKIVYMLIQNGGQIIAEKDEITNLLLDSAMTGDLDTIKLIYHSGLKNFNDYTNIDQRNIGHVAASEGQLEIIKFLKYTARFDFSQRDIWDRTPLDDALEFQHIDVVSQLQSIVY
ncbi:L-asparaginase (macronuclear) [Tetrahymena thermophila SB210]|uniref:asparaginase n=1 Tax=Tetrahymena thermophila (strain SB210) TaxID=312017 RepID=Q22LU8_TETTS|nr:L-asparaginase [Tetrahymena thermophila SB210]EAR86550.2 L-asparaginase [Tetrahymena thermophila SB210]|eukprot:XP_977272.2 L-asparaginase [Tetrahymena thermophila SB210]